MGQQPLVMCPHAIPIPHRAWLAPPAIHPVHFCLWHCCSLALVSVGMCTGGIPDDAANTVGIPSGCLPHCQAWHVGVWAWLHIAQEESSCLGD